MTVAWSPERIAFLEANWKSMTGAQLAAALTAMPGPPISRDAVGAAAYRFNLPAKSGKRRRPEHELYGDPDRIPLAEPWRPGDPSPYRRAVSR